MTAQPPARAAGRDNSDIGLILNRTGLETRVEAECFFAKRSQFYVTN